MIKLTEVTGKPGFTARATRYTDDEYFGQGNREEWHVCEDTPKKENDHAMDDMRYFVSTVLYGNEDEFFAMATKRKS